MVKGRRFHKDLEAQKVFYSPLGPGAEEKEDPHPLLSFSPFWRKPAHPLGSGAAQRKKQLPSRAL